MADEDAKKWLSCLGWGCLAVVVISALGIGGCVAFLYKGGSDSHAAVNTYLEAVEAGDFESAFLTLGPGFTEQRGLEELVAFEQAARAEMGSCGEWRMSGTSFNRGEGRSEALLSYQRSCEGGPVSASFSLEQLDGQWVIQDIRYNEPMRPVAQICAGCSDVIPPGARYCSHCGAEVGSEGGMNENNGSPAEGIDPDSSDPSTPANGQDQ